LSVVFKESSISNTGNSEIINAIVNTVVSPGYHEVKKNKHQMSRHMEKHDTPLKSQYVFCREISFLRNLSGFRENQQVCV